MKLQFYKIGFYKGYLILEVKKDTDQIYYEFCTDPSKDLSAEKFSNTELIRNHIDEIQSGRKQLWYKYSQANQICGKCFKHYDLKTEIQIAPKVNVKLLNVKESCSNCGNNFLNFTLRMN